MSDQSEKTRIVPLACNVPFSAKGMAVLAHNGDKYYAFAPGGSMIEIVGWDIGYLVKVLRDQGIMVMLCDIAAQTA